LCIGESAGAMVSRPLQRSTGSDGTSAAKAGAVNRATSATAVEARNTLIKHLLA